MTSSLPTPRTLRFATSSRLGLDVAEFEELLRARPAPLTILQQAVALYRGDFLDGFYDDWALGERYRLESQFCDVVARLMRANEAAGDYAVVLGGRPPACSTGIPWPKMPTARPWPPTAGSDSAAKP